MKDRNIPVELKKMFWKDYRGRYYQCWWEIVDHITNQFDQNEQVPHLYKNQLTIISHPYHWNDNTIYHYFKIENNKVKLTIYGTRFNGWDTEYSEPPHCKNKIYKVKKWLETLFEEE